MSTSRTIRFRRHQAGVAAAGLAVVSALPLASARWYLLPVLLIPIAVMVWAWRSGTDADATGVRVRALGGSRMIPWSQIAELAPDPKGRAVARLTDGRVMPLPAVRAVDLPMLVSASGQPLTKADDRQ
ncbi:MAG: chemotaxis protein CheW [Actinobacteria bacterium]|nr:MAG: chemotaxis protein CheW [Actinomycetota bacterium]